MSLFRFRRPPAPSYREPEDTWWFGASHMTPDGAEGDPCGGGPVPAADEDGDVGEAATGGTG